MRKILQHYLLLLEFIRAQCFLPLLVLLVVVTDHDVASTATPGLGLFTVLFYSVELLYMVTDIIS